MKTLQWFKRVSRLSLLMLMAPLVFASMSAAARDGGFPPQLGKLCGQVNGASWSFQGHTGTNYNVIAATAAGCTAGMKSVSALTKQKTHTGVLGPQTVAGPRGFRCLITLAPAHAGFCGSTATKFFWAPRLKK